MELLRQGTSIKPCGSVPAFMELWLAGDFGLMISLNLLCEYGSWLTSFIPSFMLFLSLYRPKSLICIIFLFFWRIPFNVSCKVGLLVTYCLNFCLSEKDFTFEGSFYWTQNKLLDFSINTLHISLSILFLIAWLLKRSIILLCFSVVRVILGFVLFSSQASFLEFLSVWFSEVWIRYERV